MRPEGAAASEEGREVRLPPQATMGLLDYVTAHALDEDYAEASARRTSATGRRTAPDAGSRRTARRPGALGALALGGFALLLVVAGTQTWRGAADDVDQREQLATQVTTLRDRVTAERARARELEADVARLQAAQLDSDASGLVQEVERLGGDAGLRAVRGPGVQVVVDDAPGSDSDRTRVLDSDLQRLVNGFWAAGAEAITVNGQRLTAMSAIRLAGSAITVNNRSLRAPYRLQVVGDPDTLPARFAETSSGQAWLDLQRQLGLVLEITPSGPMLLPPANPTLRFAGRADAEAAAPGADGAVPGEGGVP